MIIARILETYDVDYLGKIRWKKPEKLTEGVKQIINEFGKRLFKERYNQNKQGEQ